MTGVEVYDGVIDLLSITHRKSRHRPCVRHSSAMANSRRVTAEDFEAISWVQQMIPVRN